MQTKVPAYTQRHWGKISSENNDGSECGRSIISKNLETVQCGWINLRGLQNHISGNTDDPVAANLATKGECRENPAFFCHKGPDINEIAYDLN